MESNSDRFFFTRTGLSKKKNRCKGSTFSVKLYRIFLIEDLHVFIVMYYIIL